jgi:hypothetical protein
MQVMKIQRTIYTHFEILIQYSEVHTHFFGLYEILVIPVFRIIYGAETRKQ